MMPWEALFDRLLDCTNIIPKTSSFSSFCEVSIKLENHYSLLLVFLWNLFVMQKIILKNQKVSGNNLHLIHSSTDLLGVHKNT